MTILQGATLATIAACFLAAHAITIRLATERGSVANVLLVVTGVNIVAFVPLAVLFTAEFVVTPRAVAAFAMAGLVGAAVGRLVFYSGIERIGASRAEPIKASMPLHATVLAVLLLDEVVTGPQLLGVLFVVLGVAVVSWEGRTSTGAQETARTGVLLPFVAAFLFALDPIFATVGLKEGMNVLTGLAIKSIAAMVGFLAVLTWKDMLLGWGSLRTNRLHWFVAAGVANTGFLLVYYAGLSVSRVSVVVPIMQTSPLLVIVGSFVFLRGMERITGRLVVGSLVVVAGATLITVTG